MRVFLCGCIKGSHILSNEVWLLWQHLTEVLVQVAFVGIKEQMLKQLNCLIVHVWLTHLQEYLNLGGSHSGDH